MTDIDAIIAYENGELPEDETIALFQRLVDSGRAWSLQGHYGRTAAALIDAGYVSVRSSVRELAISALRSNPRLRIVLTHDGHEHRIGAWT